ncbi:MAG TPA: dihydrolipoamide acetyltransferase family protein [Candidatus Dormibacteraeota bacterium]|nr:dihydrolipoamide acetyltransferase family protein [Candidatus Dormibacteraeota bacterium]
MAHGPVTDGGVTMVTMPQLGESVTEGQISRWLKQPGDHVEKYEALVEVITDKVNAEVPAPIAGVLAEIKVPEGETVLVGTLICTIGAEDGAAGPGSPSAVEAGSDGAAADLAEGMGAAPTVPDTPESEPTAAEPAVVPASSTSIPAPAAPPSGSNGSDRAGRASPAVRRLADEHNLDISQISGTGIGGRVSKRDVDQFLASGGTALPGAPAPAAAAAAPAPVPAAPAAGARTAPAPQARPGDELIPLTPIRKAIAEHMVRSRQTSPHAWCAVEVDMTSVVTLRKAERERFRDREGVDLTYVPFVTKATVEALKDHPEVNATWTVDGILRRHAINISVAVSSPGGLVVPVIHDADMLSIAGLAHKLNDIATRARAGQLKLPDIEGGTFCVNNPGTFGTVVSAPIINQPQAAIMTMEAIVKRPVVLPGDVIGIRSIMFLGMSFDHRVIDGLEAATFLVDVKKNLEAMGSGTPIF